MRRSQVCWLLVATTAAAAAAVGGAHSAVRDAPLPPPRALQEAMEVPAQVVANATEAPTTSASSAADDEDRAAAPSDGTGTTSAPSTEPDDRIVTSDADYRRGSPLSTQGIVGIAVGCVAAIALAIAFVRAGSSKRKLALQNQQHDELMGPQDLGSSTMSVKSVKYVESFDSSAVGTPRTSIAVIRKPSPPLRSQALGSSMHNSGANGSTTAASEHASAAAALSQSSVSVGAARRATMEDVEEFNPSRTVRTFSKSQRSVSAHKAPLSPESYLKFAQSSSKNSFRQSRRASRHSRTVESPDTSLSSSFSATSSPAVRAHSRLRFTRRSSVHHESAGGDDNAADIPMLGGGSAMNGLSDSSRSVHLQHTHHQHHNQHHQHDSSSDNSDDEYPTSPRDIPVLARGSEESVDSIEDDDVEISI